MANDKRFIAKNGILTTETVTAGFFSGDGTSVTNVDAELLDGQEGAFYQNASNLNAGTINDARLPATITSNITGNAATATRWATARTLSLTGAVTGSTSIDGSGNVSISTTATADPTLTLNGDVSGSATFTNLTDATLTVTVANDSHTHAFNNLTGKTSGSGDYSTTGNLESGRGSGGVALTINDSQGNANVTFNHANGVAEQAGNVGRIVVNTDSTTGASMDFEIDNNATAGTVTLSPVFSVTPSGVTLSTGTYSGNGSGLTSLNASNISSGTISDARLPATISSNITGNAATATRWATARTITLSGAVTGSTSIDGTGNVSIATSATSDPTLTLSGDATGSATFTNLGNATLSVSVNGGNATTLDSLDSTAFLRSNANDTHTGSVLTINNNLDMVGPIRHSGDGDTYLQFHAADQWRVVTGGAERVEVTNAGTTVRNGLTVDSGTSSTLSVLCDDGGEATINAMGGGQGTGILYAGQSTTHGGGVFYNGDSTPAFATGEGSDRISFFRREASANEVVFSYSFSSNTVDFRGSITSTGDVSASTFTGNGAGITSVNAATLDSINSTSFLRSDATDTMSGRLDYTATDPINTGRGINGGYGNTTGSGSDWGANIWSIGNSWDGAGTGPSYTLDASQYGMSWLRGTHPSAVGVVGEGLYCYQAGNRFAAMGSAGTLFDTIVRATGDVVAFYSDERLKNFHGKIDNALDKVTALNGYYFTENEVAKSLGYNNDEVQLGVSAQEVKAIFPEAVAVAPISYSDGVDEEYLTVKYEKLVPALIEAIKEQQSQIDELKQMVNNLSKS